MTRASKSDSWSMPTCFRAWGAANGRTTPQISMLVDAFLYVTDVKLVKADVACCWNELPQTISWQRDKGALADVISHLDNLAQCLLTRKAWDELVCSLPSAVPHTLCWSRHLGYIQGQVVQCCLPCSSTLASLMETLCVCGQGATV